VYSEEEKANLNLVHFPYDTSFQYIVLAKKLLEIAASVFPGEDEVDSYFYYYYSLNSYSHPTPSSSSSSSSSFPSSFFSFVAMSHAYRKVWVNTIAFMIEEQNFHNFHFGLGQAKGYLGILPAGISLVSCDGRYFVI
jgi:hypothetical protein